MKTYDFLDGRPLNPWYAVEIVREENTKFVFFRSEIHFNRRAVMPTSYCADEFTDSEILRDRHLLSAVVARYGDVWGTKP